MFGLIASSIKPHSEKLSWQESQQKMKDNPTLNTGVGTYHLSFPIMGGQSCYDLIAEVELPLRFFLENP